MKLPNRMIVLISALQELKGYISEENINQLLFIYCYKYACNNKYDFILVNNQPYCLTLYEDKRFLIDKNILTSSGKWEVSSSIPRFVTKLTLLEKLSLQNLKNDITNNLISTDVIKENYDKYYKQEIVNHENKIFYTIGYEGLSLEQYLNKLRQYQIKCLCDVRRNPYSQKYGFSKNELCYALSLINIKYIHIPELGISSSMRSELKSDSDYRTLLKMYETDILPRQETSITLLNNLINEYKQIAITCFEANISHCHRSKIASLLQKAPNKDYTAKHI